MNENTNRPARLSDDTRALIRELHHALTMPAEEIDVFEPFDTLEDAEANRDGMIECILDDMICLVTDPRDITIDHAILATLNLVHRPHLTF